MNIQLGQKSRNGEIGFYDVSERNFKANGRHQISKSISKNEPIGDEDWADMCRLTHRRKGLEAIQSNDRASYGRRGWDRNPISSK